MKVPKDIIKDLKDTLGVIGTDADRVWIKAAATILEAKAREIRQLCDLPATTDLSAMEGYATRSINPWLMTINQSTCPS